MTILNTNIPRSRLTKGTVNDGLAQVYSVMIVMLWGARVERRKSEASFRSHCLVCSQSSCFSRRHGLLLICN